MLTDFTAESVGARILKIGGFFTAGFMTHVTCRLTAKNRDQLRNPALGNRVLPLPFIIIIIHFISGSKARKTQQAKRQR